MTYGIFNTDSGNLIDSYRSEKRVLAAVAEIIEHDGDVDQIALVITNRGQTVKVVTGDSLREAAAPYAPHVAA